MSELITPKKFLELWKEKIKETPKLDIGMYGRTKAFTDLILKQENCVMKEIVKTLKEEYFVEKESVITEFKEYFKIDYTVWEDYKGKLSKTVKSEGLTDHCSRMIIAMEHENNSSGWTDEFAKLFSVHCDLRVVVGYSKNVDGIIDYLNIVTELITNRQSSYYGGYLLILGKQKKAFNETSTREDIANGYQGYQLVDNNGKLSWEAI